VPSAQTTHFTFKNSYTINESLSASEISPATGNWQPTTINCTEIQKIPVTRLETSDQKPSTNNPALYSIFTPNSLAYNTFFPGVLTAREFHISLPILPDQDH
jgi:hypothetical protein